MQNRNQQSARGGGFKQSRNRFKTRFAKPGQSSSANPGRSHHAAPRPAEPEVVIAMPEGDVALDGVFGRLLPELQHALVRTGYSVPTPIQAQAIPPLIDGRDLLGSAQTGTGKTAAFTLPLLQKLAGEAQRAESRRPRALIIAPTRELVAQIGESLSTYGRHLRVSHTTIYGGVGQRPQEVAMNRGVDIVVATPGRLLDLINQGFVKLDRIGTLVLDEADRMLDMGFIHDIRKILKLIPTDRQTGFFSATLSREVTTLAQGMLRNPASVSIAPERPTVERIGQKVLFVDKEHKDTLLISLLEGAGVDRAIVFAQMKHVANRVSEKLARAGIAAAPIHGNKSQAARMKALAQFKNGKVRVLVATDVAARGIDVDGITHVFNYDLPNEPETYVHRIGRTARAGADGDAISFCTAEERGTLRSIERLICKAVPVDMDHAFHSERAFNSRGASSGPAPRGGRNSGRGGGGGGGGRSFARRGNRGFEPAGRNRRSRSR